METPGTGQNANYTRMIACPLSFYRTPEPWNFVILCQGLAKGPYDDRYFSQGPVTGPDGHTLENLELGDRRIFIVKERKR